jgi:hypothetical protein
MPMRQIDMSIGHASILCGPGIHPPPEGLDTGSDDAVTVQDHENIKDPLTRGSRWMHGSP